MDRGVVAEDEGERSESNAAGGRGDCCGGLMGPPRVATEDRGVSEEEDGERSESNDDEGRGEWEGLMGRVAAGVL